jgi:Calcineurin-like phosphoesterase
MLKKTKKIPLHSLVLLFEDNPKIEDKFRDYEVLSSKKIALDLTDDDSRKDMDYEIFNEIKRRTQNKLIIGERAIIKLPLANQYYRKQLAQVGSDLNRPVFYIVSSDSIRDFKSKNTREDNLQNILRGDGVAEVIDLTREDFDVIHKYSTDPELLYGEIINKGYYGITIIPDVHSCYEALLSAVSWAKNRNHLIIFLGDIIDYGPRPFEVLDEVHKLIVRGEALFILGNHEVKIQKWLQQSKQNNIRIRISSGNAVTIDKLKRLDQHSLRMFETKFRTLMSLGRNHIMIRNLLCTHGAAHEKMWTNYSTKLDEELESYALFGEVNPKQRFNENGFPNRIYDWVDKVPADKMVVVGHDIRSLFTPFKKMNEKGGTVIFLDTGSGKGGVLSSMDLKLHSDGTLHFLNYNQH